MRRQTLGFRELGAGLWALGLRACNAYFCVMVKVPLPTVAMSIR
jgi:hypothetical protein